MNIQTIHQTQANDLALVGNSLTMNSREIAELTGKRHDNVRRTIESLARSRVIQLTQIEEVKNHLGQSVDVYVFKGEQGKRDSLVVVAQLSPEFTGALVDRWQELEQQQAPKLPSSYIEALETLVQTEKEKLAIAHERDEAIRTKAQIGSSREATAMATASAARREAERLKNELGKGAKQATITAVENATGEKLGRRAYIPMRKWCKEHGVTAADVKDDRYGSVKAWPAGAWLDCFDIDLQKLFGSEA